MVRSSLTAFCTPCTNSGLWSCNCCIVIVAAVERSASTNLSSTSSFNASGCSVRWPSVWAALAMPSWLGITRTKNAATISTRMRSLVMRLSALLRITSSFKVFMLTGMTSWKIGSTIAPPSLTTFCPPNPVRTNDRSFDARW